ncbi:SIMPL domain-containing protein [SAR92 clade bacterium H455]|uniref:SIMPL domain-containing protein n=1 Tax=SAR92 clade bacterium H455 TaxID=2974818 RepID=A0ABY5TQ67_9GAMM|nr:SIMPL domain-containing protein [SAR92 clade bacterium H455]
MIRLTTCLLFCSLHLNAFAQPELKGSPNELRHFLHPNDKIVTLSAEAEEKAYSDRAIISLLITSEDKLLSVSISNNIALRESISQQLVSAGINPEYIKSSTFSTSPQYGWFGKKPDSYKVVNRMAVTITEESQLNTIAGVADSEEEIELSDITFEHSKKDAYKSKVKQLALEKVMKQKALYESSLGVKLTPVSFRDNRLWVKGTQGAQMLEEVVVTASKRSRSYKDSAADFAQSVAPRSVESSFDEIVYTAEIFVDFSTVTDKTQ